MKNRIFLFTSLFLVFLSATVIVMGYLIKTDSSGSYPVNTHTENQISKVQRNVEYTRTDGKKVSMLVDFQKTESGWKMTSMKVK